MTHFLTKPLLFISLVGILVSCTPTVHLDSTLENEGMQGLSVQDPFFGPNILLGKEMERSNFLHSFVKEHGAPQALELEKRTLSDYRMYMYYPYEGQVYVAEPQDTSTNPQWVVRGPMKPNWKDQRRALQLAKVQDDIPVLYVFGKSVRYGRMYSKASEEARVLKPVVPPTHRTYSPPPMQQGLNDEYEVEAGATKPKPKPTPKAKPKKKKKEESAEEAQDEQDQVEESTDEQATEDNEEASSKKKVKKKPKPTPTPKKVVEEYKPLNTDQQAILMSKGFAERAPNGDLVHKVVSPDESLALIALWYTGKVFHAKELAMNNQLSIDEPLLEGERITIPQKLVKQFKVMPRDFVFSDEYQKTYGPKKN